MNPVQTKTIDGVKTINLHGKNYVEVSERVRQAHEKGSEFSILQVEPFNISERWFVRATIMANSKQYIGTAEIKFTAPKNTPDGTNPYECAETSAVGRALGFAGFGSVEGIASYDEVARSQPTDAIKPSIHTVASQESTEPAEPSQPTNSTNAPTPRQLRKRSIELYGKDRLDDAKVKYLGGNIPDDNMTPEQCAIIKSKFDEVLASRNVA